MHRNPGARSCRRSDPVCVTFEIPSIPVDLVIQPNQLLVKCKYDFKMRKEPIRNIHQALIKTQLISSCIHSLFPAGEGQGCISQVLSEGADGSRQRETSQRRRWDESREKAKTGRCPRKGYRGETKGEQRWRTRTHSPGLYFQSHTDLIAVQFQRLSSMPQS